MNKTVTFLMIMSLGFGAFAQYPFIRIADVEVSPDNQDDITSDYISGTVRYDSTTRTLTLQNAYIREYLLPPDYIDVGRSIYISGRNQRFTIELIGDNVVVGLVPIAFLDGDFDIKGPGVLYVYGYINNGITCKDDLDLDGGTVYIFAANNGIKGSESIEINDGKLTIKSGNDALKATSTKPGKGYVEIDNGVCLLYAGGNGISAETDVIVYGGETVIESEKEPVKADGILQINGGSLIGNGAAY